MTARIPRATLLVVDDDPALLEALAFFLSDEGYEVVGSSSSAPLHRLLAGETAHPDAIVLDMLLSGDNGRNLCEALKENPGTAGIPVVLMSAHPHAAANASRADRFVAKPFEVDDLLAAIESALGDRPAPVEHRKATDVPA